MNDQEENEQSKRVTNGQPEEDLNEQTPPSRIDGNQEGDPGGTIEQPPEQQNSEVGGHESKTTKQSQNFIKKPHELLKWYKELLVLLVPAVLGVRTSYKWFGEWWFGLGFTEWHLLILLGVCLVFFLAFLIFISCSKRYSMRTRIVSRLVAAIVLSFIIGVILTSAIHYKRRSAKTVILVNAFEGFKEQDYGFADILRSHLEKAVKRCSLDQCVKVISVKEPTHKDSGKRLTAEILGKRHRADIVISGWYCKKEKFAPVSIEFFVINQPKELGSLFRGEKLDTNDAFAVKVEDVDMYNLQYYLKDEMLYQSILALGLAVYGNRQWEIAKSCFDEALTALNNNLKMKLERPKQEVQYSNSRRERRLVDKELLQLLSGNCCLNLGEFDEAICRYNAIISRYSETTNDPNGILSKVYVSRAVAYRQKNAFEAAAADFKNAGTNEQPYYNRKDRAELFKLAEQLYKRGHYYINKELLKHAQAEWSASAGILVSLSEEAPYDFGSTYRLKLLRSFVSLAEAHRWQAPIGLPEYDPHTEEAEKYLRRALKTIGFFDKPDQRNLTKEDSRELLRFQAYYHRERGEVYFAQEKYCDANDAHYEACKEYQQLKKGSNDPNECNEYQIKVAGQLVRLGDVYRRKSRVGEWDDKVFDKAIVKYREAVRELGGEEFLTDPNKGRPNLPVSSVERILKKAIAEYNAHHLANSLTHLAEGYLERKMICEQHEKEGDSNNLEYAVWLLECAARVYDRIDEYEKKMKTQLKHEWEKWQQQLREERNTDLRDDRAWCLTIYGHGLITQEQYEKAEEQLEKAGELHYKLVREGMDEDNLTWNLFTLAAAQYRLQKRSQDAAGNFLEACNRLRTMMKKKKKIWFSDYLDDIFNKLQRSDKVEEEVCKSIPDLQKWLSPDSVRKGKNALDNIIKNLEKARPQTHNKEYIR